MIDEVMLLELLNVSTLGYEFMNKLALIQETSQDVNILVSSCLRKGNFKSLDLFIIHYSLEQCKLKASYNISSLCLTIYVRLEKLSAKYIG